MKHGLLLINLGTPDAPDKAAVRRYLRQFLSDKRVVDLPFLPRYLLLYGILLPLRPKQSAKAYQTIWTSEGSPLLLNSFKLVNKLQEAFGDNLQVALGMRYGKPSLAEALDKLADCQQLTILPLYPQYSSAATGSSIASVLELLAKKTVQPSLTIIRDFYNHQGFIEPQAALIRPQLSDNKAFVLFSFHGLPERHLLSSGCPAVCEGSCPSMKKSHPACYRAQCFETSRLLARTLGLDDNQYSIAFQSRLGRTPWIKPYTDIVLPELAAKGIKRLIVACPSFVADCLETLEEIGHRAQAQWLQLGGESLTLIPCLNDNDAWVKGIIDICDLKRLNQ